jgi:hypothetical protein
LEVVFSSFDKPAAKISLIFPSESTLKRRETSGISCHRLL